jgi:hypothetical protein
MDKTPGQVAAETFLNVDVEWKRGGTHVEMIGHDWADALFGMKIYEAPEPPPVIQIPAGFKFCSDEFRAKHDLWLLETFGRKEPIVAMGTAFFSGLYGWAVMNKSDIVRLTNLA